MKNKYLNWLQYGMVAVLSLVVVFSCNQMETFESDLLSVEEQQALLKNSPDTGPYFNSRTAFSESVNCENDAIYCVSSENYYYKSLREPIQGGGWGGIDLEYYQQHKDYMKYKFVAYAGNNGKVEIIEGYKIGDEPRVDLPEKRRTLDLEIALDEEWIACGAFDRKIIIYYDKSNNDKNPEKSSFTFDTKYTLLAKCENGDDDDDDDDDDDEECDAEDFYYNKMTDDPADYTYTFTYIPACEEMLGAVVKFTCPHVEAIDSFKVKVDDGSEFSDADWSSNPGKRRGAPTVISWTGDIPEEGITFEVKFKPDCTQTNSGRANVWTDFKVNEVSKKFEHSNIIAHNCGSKR